MAFLKQLLSKVTIAVAAGAAEQAGRHALTEAWNKRKQTKSDETDANGTVVAETSTPTNPVSKFISDKWAKFKADKEAREYLNKQTSEQEAPTDEQN